jgi:hypothetical protein
VREDLFLNIIRMASGIEGPGTISIFKLAISEMNIIVIVRIQELLYSAHRKCQSSSTGMQSEIRTLDLLDVCISSDVKII